VRASHDNGNGTYLGHDAGATIKHYTDPNSAQPDGSVKWASVNELERFGYVAGTLAFYWYKYK
jgi:hypothetical protein